MSNYSFHLFVVASLCPPAGPSIYTLQIGSEHIAVHATSLELYVAELRIVQLAFSSKPCPPTQIRLTSQTGFRIIKLLNTCKKGTKGYTAI